MKKKIAYIFQDGGSWFICDADLDYLDTRGNAYRSKVAAKRAASCSDYTHYKCGEIVKKISKREHEMNWATG